MIRISLISKHYQQIELIIKQLLADMNLEYHISNYRHQSIQDIYFIEVEKMDDLNILNQLKTLDSTLIYIIGPRNFDIVSRCLELQTHLYFVKDDFSNELIKHEKLIQRHIQKNFQYYIYQRNGIISKIRLSQMYYIESLRHQIIIHSINGEMVERKPLSQFIKELKSNDFVQIHKSFIVNKNFIKEIKSQEVILKDMTVLPIGRSYKSTLQNKYDFIK